MARALILEGQRSGFGQLGDVHQGVTAVDEGRLDPADHEPRPCRFDHREPASERVGDHAEPIAGDSQVRLLARSRGDEIVAFDGPAHLVGTITRVRATRATSLTLFAERLNG